MSVFALIVAAGKGKRFGGAKQFYCINGRPILYYTLSLFQKNKRISRIIAVVPKQTVAMVRKCIQEWEIGKITDVVAGGEKRQDSVRNGLKKTGTSRGIVVIHDGARPIVSQRIINQGLRLCKRYKAVVCGLPVSDTVKYVTKNVVKHTVSRSHLYMVQTPQFFDLTTLRQAYQQIDTNNLYTDDASVVEAAGIPVHVYKGDHNNIKVTHQRDIKRITRLLSCKT